MNREKIRGLVGQRGRCLIDKDLVDMVNRLRLGIRDTDAHILMLFSL